MASETDIKREVLQKLMQQMDGRERKKLAPIYKPAEPKPVLPKS